MTDTELKIKGVQSLSYALGLVGAERFIALIQREPFDYTKWQQTLFDEYSVRELSQMAMKSMKENQD